MLFTLYMANTNRFKGLANGAIDNKSSSLINQISAASIDMGSVVALVSSITSSETLPRVNTQTAQGLITYGIAVRGDVDGIYGDGSASSDDSTRATNAAGQGIVIVTQGRCLARVSGDGSGVVTVGDPLTQSASSGVLELATTGDLVIAIALNDVGAGDIDMIAVDVQREGIF